MIGSVEVITPAMARAMLAKNGQNRPLTPTLIRRYAEEMKAGRWNTNGQGLIFSPDGTLLDGQHRLHALIEADVTVEMFVVRGVPQDRFETMDSGRARTVGDVLGASGYKNSNNLAAIARLAFNYTSGASMSYGPTKGALVAFVHRYPYLQEVTNKIASNRPVIPGSPLGAVLFLANAGHQRLETEADEFLDGLKTGENLCKNDPRLTLREWFYAQRAKERGVIGGELAFAACARAWNAFAQRRELSILKQLYGPNRRSLPIYDWDSDYFAGVDDVQERQKITREQNLAMAPSHRRNVG